MNASEVITYMEKPQVNLMKFGLENTRQLMARLGNPQDQLRYIHIAGTNGKGSTAAMTSAMLLEAGYKVGLFTSPYLEHFTEKISANGSPIPDEDFAQIGTQVIETVQAMEKEGAPHPTLFEMTTAIAFVYYAKAKCDVVVLEVGLGGRLDTTNIIQSPLVSVITNIGFDHMDILGDTLEKITFEKCGIIKEGCKVVTYPDLPLEALSVVQKTVEEKKANWHQAVMPKSIQLSFVGISFVHERLGEIRVSLLGEHQAKNACTAIEAVLVSGLKITEEQMMKGIQKAAWPGRMELWQKDPIIVLDGAHNLQGITQLVQNLRKYFKGKKITILFGMLKDKEVEQSIALLHQAADAIILTEVPNPRTESADKMGMVATSLFQTVKVETNYVQALQLAKQLVKQGDVLCICGSLYLIGAVRHILSNEN